MINLKRLPNNNLLIELTDRQAFNDLLTQKEDNLCAITIADILEEGRYLGNDWYDLTGQIGLFSGDAIGYGAIYLTEEDESPADYENIWYDPNYAIRCFAEVLIEQGSIEFINAK